MFTIEVFDKFSKIPFFNYLRIRKRKIRNKYQNMKGINSQFSFVIIIVKKIFASVLSLQEIDYAERLNHPVKDIVLGYRLHSKKRI